MIGGLIQAHLLSILIGIPLVAAVIGLFVSANGARWTALVATMLDFALSLYLWAQYNPDGAQWQFVEKSGLGGGVNWALGIDGIALLLIVLTAFLMPICIGASWRSIDKRVPEYMAYFLLMEALILGSFAAQDLFLFYIFFEGGLIPMYFIIGVWGGPRKLYAAIKFFLYTLTGSVLMLIGILTLYFAHANQFGFYTFEIADLMRTDMPLALLIFAIGAEIWGKVRDGESWTARDRLIAFALLAAAMLVKGPIVYAFLLPGIVCCRLAWQRNVWCGWWPWLASLAVFIVWLGMGLWRVPEFLELVVIREFGGRFEGTHAAQPLYFYIPHLLGKFAPWSLLLIGFAIALRRTRMARETLWLLAWSVGGLIVMSLIPSKRVDRIFPVVPPLCLLIGAQFNQLKQMRFARVMTLIALGISLIAVPAYCATKIATGYRHHRDAYVQFAHRVLAAASPQFAVIGGEDEGLLLYLRKSEFTQPSDAIAKWNRGEIDAIVAPEDAIPKLTERLPDAVPSSIGLSGPAGNHGTRYALIVRR